MSFPLLYKLRSAKSLQLMRNNWFLKSNVLNTLGKLKYLVHIFLKRVAALPYTVINDSSTWKGTLFDTDMLFASIISHQCIKRQSITKWMIGNLTGNEQRQNSKCIHIPHILASTSSFHRKRKVFTHLNLSKHQPKELCLWISLSLE